MMTALTAGVGMIICVFGLSQVGKSPKVRHLPAGSRVRLHGILRHPWFLGSLAGVAITILAAFRALNGG
jgi:hypothetical protein